MLPTPGQSGPGSDGNEGIQRIAKKLQHYWNHTIRLLTVISRTLVRGVLHPLQRSSQCILQQKLTRQRWYKFKSWTEMFPFQIELIRWENTLIQTIFSSALGKKYVSLGSLSLVFATSLGEGKLLIQTC